MAAFRPAFPLVAAERHVDYPRLAAHIDMRRTAVGGAITPSGLRLARTITATGAPAPFRVAAFAETLSRSLAITFAFGEQQARAELNHGLPHRLMTVPPFPPRTTNPDTVSAWLSEVGKTAAAEYAARLVSLQQRPPSPVPDHGKVAFLDDRARREAWNLALELVTRTLNAGRVFAANAHRLLHPQPLYAMRSEQLDENTCAACTSLHGTVAMVGSQQYVDMIPPAFCFGGGRCRGIFVYSHDRVDLEASVARLSETPWPARRVTLTLAGRAAVRTSRVHRLHV